MITDSEYVGDDYEVYTPGWASSRLVLPWGSNRRSRGRPVCVCVHAWLGKQ
jgi:hypothetical protein